MKFIVHRRYLSPGASLTLGATLSRKGRGKKERRD